MRIAISGMFWSEPHVGSGQYLHNLVAHFATAAPDHRFILVLPRYRQAHKPSLPRFQTVLMPTPFDGRSDNLAKVWFEQVALNQVCRKLRADVVHVPYFGAPRLGRTPVVVTVHDLIPLMLPEYRGSRGVQLYMRLAAAGARRAHTIIADSHHTRHDILERFDVAAEQVVVTHLAAAPAFAPQPAERIAAVRERFQLREPYIYYVGGFDARKNVATAIRAFARMRRASDTPVTLALAGRLPTPDGTLFPDINRVILEEGVAADVALLGAVSQEDSVALMSGCAAFVYPSRYEGFGLPPLEAMQCGAPVLAAATSSVGEVVADGGVQLPPDDVAAWAQALGAIVGSAELRQQWRDRGLRRAAEFGWQRTAEQTLAVYNNLRPDREARAS